MGHAFAIVLITLAPAAVATTFIHEFGHLLIRKALGWPPEYVRIPGKSKTWKVIGHIWNARLELGSELKSWLKGGGITGPWPPSGYDLEQVRRGEACLILLGGSLANPAQAAVSLTIRTIMTSLTAHTCLSVFAAIGLLSAAFNLAPVGGDSDGIQLWSRIFGEPTKPARILAWLTAAALTILAAHLFAAGLVN